MIRQIEYAVRPGYQQGESLAGYVFRFYSANGHGIPPLVRRLVVRLYKRRALDNLPPYGGQRETLELLQHFLGDECVLDRTWWLEGDFLSRYHAFGGNALRLCPKCINAFEIHQSVWDLPLVAACPIHHCRLLDRCLKCQKHLWWSTVDLDWRCRCGQDLTQMISMNASPTEVRLSAVLIGATDGLCTNFYRARTLKALKFTPQRLEVTYRRLDNGLALRDTLRAALRTHQPRSPEEWRRLNSRQLPGQWELSLFEDWPRTFQELLLRLARRYWRSNNATFVLASEDTPINDVLSKLGSRKLGGSATNNLAHAMQQLVDAFRAPFCTATLVLYNPRYSEEQRNKRLLHFWRWWHALQRMTLKNLRSESSPTSLSYPMRERSREAIAITLLSRLIDAADRGADGRRYASIVPDVIYVGSGLRPLALVVGLMEALLNVQYPRLTSLLVQLDQVESEEDAQ